MLGSIRELNNVGDFFADKPLVSKWNTENPYAVVYCVGTNRYLFGFCDEIKAKEYNRDKNQKFSILKVNTIKEQDDLLSITCSVRVASKYFSWEIKNFID